MICADDACARVARERGLAPVVLCADCAGRRPAFARRPWAAPIIALVGAAGLVSLGLAGARGALAGLCSLAGVALVVLGGAVAVVRWQWRSRLARARRGARGR
jgi:hypothetical protein